MRKYMSPIEFLFIAIAIGILPFVGCSSKTIGPLSKAVIPETTNMLYVPIVQSITQIKHDTIKAKAQTKQRTAAQIRKDYGSIIDTLFSPEFDRMTSIINGQQSSIDKLTNVITSMRGRSISFRDSMQRVNAKKDSELYAFKKREIEKSDLQIKQNKEQLNKLNTIINVLIVYCLVSFILIISLAIVCRIMWLFIKPKRI